MYISKKNKIILGVTIPSAALVIGSAIAIPTVLVHNDNQLKQLNNLQNIAPTLIAQQDINDKFLSEILFNPTKYTQSFFVERIANQSYTYNNKQVITNNLLFSFNSKDKNYYKIKTIFQQNNQLKAEVEKRVGNFSNTYIVDIQVPSNYFEANENISKSNFMDSSLMLLENMFLAGNLQVGQTSANTNISQITQRDLVINSFSDSPLTVSSFNSNGETLYYAPYSSKEAISKLLWYSEKQDWVGFSPMAQIGSDKTIWTAQEAYSLNASNEFDSASSLAYQFLSKNIDKLLLPTLTENESQGLTPEQIKTKQLQKFIFDPTKDPSTILNGYYVPKSDYQAMIVKVVLSGAQPIEKYMLVWQNIFATAPASVLDKAAEIQYKAASIFDPDLGLIQPTADQLLDKNNWNLLKPTLQPAQGFNYEIQAVEIPQSAQELKNKLELTIQVRHDKAPGTKTYKTLVTNLTPQPLYKFNKNILEFLKAKGDVNSIVPLVPTVALNHAKLTEDSNNPITNVYELQTKLNTLIQQQNYTEFNAFMTLTPPTDLPQNLANMQYIPYGVSVNGEKITIVYSLAIQVAGQTLESQFGTVDVVVNWTP